ncbi:hypothetical protein [Enterovirga aerilata]|uniref:Translation initiation factor IF-2 n=1 Tax=Enterovirga aerilata TaxID=2730920 RepID=A0A849IDZ4_9HYPH|nr:hypothetical protein [Enterovirga sp. DB1703]NNM72113.1 hypothetical protein [Enterovirga sp. DB1703]
MTVRHNLALAAAAGALLLAGAAQAQYALTPGAVPPPPSLRESTRPADGKAPQRGTRRPAEGEAGAAAESRASAPRRKLRAPSAAAEDGGYAGRIDSRPPRSQPGRFELEDDPRAVTPTFNNGRPGVGMRF